MIVYELACTNGHRFEGWFASGEDFGEQRERGLLTCPMCDDAHVERVPSARVSVPKGQAAVPRPSPVSAPNAPGPHAPGPNAPAPPNAASQAIASGLPPELVAQLREIVKQTENVGRRFPEEARKIHYEEVPPRPIRGQASPEEAKSLTEEGIEFAPLPPFLLPEQH